MIVLRILSPDQTKLMKVAQLLLENRLITDLNIKSNIERIKLGTQGVSVTKIYLLTGITKALLYSEIEKTIKANFNDIPEIYSVPVIHMDWEQTNRLTKSIRPV